MSDLLPCPFCGGDELSHGYQAGGQYFGVVQCHTCDAFVTAEEETDAIAAWNTRAPAPLPWQSQAAADVMAERTRQVSGEGWTAAHDDIHTLGELSGAAACYALYRSQLSAMVVMGENVIETVWPWSLEWWKPTTRRRDLVKAGALILAEIERLDRAAPPLPMGARDDPRTKAA